MRQAITDQEQAFFLRNGYLILRGILGREELDAVSAEMMRLVEYGSSEERPNPDYAYGEGHLTGRKVLRRIEYVIDKSDPMKALLGHPYILRSVEKLMGKDLIPTWDSMVIKLPGEGIVVPWHRDAGTGCVGDSPIFNVDFYLDEADEDTCVWVIPGSHLWPQSQVDAWLGERKDTDRFLEDFRLTGAVPALMRPGDVLFHNILVLHGSPSNASQKLRRVVYYEFRTAHVEETLGPHVPAYIALKQKLLLACLDRRRATPYASEEIPFVYNPPPPYDEVLQEPRGELSTYRYPHAEFWRS